MKKMYVFFFSYFLILWMKNKYSLVNSVFSKMCTFGIIIKKRKLNNSPPVYCSTEFKAI